MSFKMMDGVEVYDKTEVDGIAESINTTIAQHTSDITQLTTKTNSLETSKANTSSVQALSNSLAADEQRLTGAENNISEHSQRITALENNSVSTTEFNQAMNEKADKAYAQQTRQTANNNHSDIAALEDRVTNIENNKLNTSDLPQAVSSAIDTTINTKLALIESDINQIVDQRSATVISGAVMTTSEATAIVDQYF